MQASDSDLRALQPRERKYKFSCANALFVEVYPGGGNYFVWKYYFPPSRKGQQRWHQIDPYGKGPGKWTLKQARNEQARLDVPRTADEATHLLKLDYISRKLKGYISVAQDLISIKKIKEAQSVASPGIAQ